MKRSSRKVNIGVVSASCAALIFGSIIFFSSQALAQTYPNKPIRLIIPMATGGSQDIMGRIIAQRFSERLGQTVVSENRGGGGGNIGYELAAKARPDGYTILLGASSLTISPSLYKKLNYDPIRDFAAISLIAQSTYALIVRPSLPANSLKELVEYARANPGRLSYGSSGLGSSAQLANELLKSLTKINVMHVPYKGAGQMLVGLMSGEVDMLVIVHGTAMPAIQTGKARALAVLSERRVPSLPNVPTIKEAGIDNCVVQGWLGLLVPGGTPPEIVNRLNAEWINIAAMPDTKEQMQKAGYEALSGTPEQFSEFLKTETVRWAKVIKEANIVGVE